jgi:U3 small nucleolar ribonucleoprotein protein IMP4
VALPAPFHPAAGPRDWFAEGKPVPTELRREAAAIAREIESEDARTGSTLRSHVDDEYSVAGTRIPKVCVTTSRYPSSRLKAFAKEVRLVFPTSQRINRGNTTVGELVDACRRADFTDIVMVQETRGEPDALIVSHLPFGPTVFFTISSPVLRHDIDKVGHVSEAFPHIILDGFSTKVGDRVASVLKHLFPVPKEDSKRVITFANRDDYVSFRHHTYTVDKTLSKSASSATDEAAAAPGDVLTGKAAQVVLTEIGPRFEMQPYLIRLGTLEQDTAETEWVFRRYTNTASKIRVL